MLFAIKYANFDPQRKIYSPHPNGGGPSKSDMPTVARCNSLCWLGDKAGSMLAFLFHQNGVFHPRCRWEDRRIGSGFSSRFIWKWAAFVQLYWGHAGGSQEIVDVFKKTSSLCGPGVFLSFTLCLLP